jgi:hypothetical protein
MTKFWSTLTDLKKLKANIFVMDLCRIPQQKDLLLQALKEDDKLMVNPNPNPSSGKRKLWRNQEA